MHNEDLQEWEHSHTFGQETRRPGENRTLIVIALTALTMTAEIAAGLIFGSMALLADGLHMASQSAALTINAFAYVYDRRHAGSSRFSFGTGKVNALGGFTGAILLAVFAALMAWESTRRFLHPTGIAFNQAIFVAVLGMIVNAISVLILDAGDPRRGHGAGHPDGHHHDHNLRSAYLHVLTDALTSVLAIAALLGAKYSGFTWMDAAVGIVGAILVARWSIGLLRATCDMLLDRPSYLCRDHQGRRAQACVPGRIQDAHPPGARPRPRLDRSRRMPGGRCPAGERVRPVAPPR